jgi:hypothetical protein
VTVSPRHEGRRLQATARERRGRSEEERSVSAAASAGRAALGDAPPGPHRGARPRVHRDRGLDLLEGRRGRAARRDLLRRLYRRGRARVAAGDVLLQRWARQLLGVAAPGDDGAQARSVPRSAPPAAASLSTRGQRGLGPRRDRPRLHRSGGHGALSRARQGREARAVSLGRGRRGVVRGVHPAVDHP